MIKKLFEYIISAEVEQFFLFMLTGFTIATLVFVTYKLREELYSAIKGSDAILQITEFIVLLWLVWLSYIIIADVTFDKKASSNVWWTMDIILLLTLLGAAALKKFLRIDDDNKANTKRNSPPSSDNSPDMD